MANNFGKHIAEVDFGVKINVKIDDAQVIKDAKNAANKAFKQFEQAVRTEVAQPTDVTMFNRHIGTLDKQIGKKVTNRVVHIIESFNTVGNLVENGQYGHPAIVGSIRDMGKAISKAFNNQIKFGVTAGQDIVRALNNIKPEQLNPAELKTLVQTNIVGTTKAINRVISKRREDIVGAIEAEAELERKLVAEISKASDGKYGLADIRKMEQRLDKIAQVNTEINKLKSDPKYAAEASRLEGLITKTRKLSNDQQKRSLEGNLADAQKRFDELAKKLGTSSSDPLKELADVQTAKADALAQFIAANKTKIKKDGTPIANAKQAFKDELQRLKNEANEAQANFEALLKKNDVVANITDALNKEINKVALASKLLAQYQVRRTKLDVGIQAQEQLIKTIKQLDQEEQNVYDAYLAEREKQAPKRAQLKTIATKGSAQVLFLEKARNSFEDFAEHLYTKLYEGHAKNLEGFNKKLKSGLEQVLNPNVSASDKLRGLTEIMTLITSNIDGIKNSGNETLRSYARKLGLLHEYVGKIVAGDSNLLSNLPTKAQDLQSTFSALGNTSNSFGLKARENLKTQLEAPFNNVQFAGNEARNAAKQLQQYFATQAVTQVEQIFKSIAGATNSDVFKDAANKLLQVSNGAFSTLANNLLQIASTLESLASGNKAVLPELLGARDKVIQERNALSTQISKLPDGLDKRTYSAYHASLGNLQGSLEGNIDSARTGVIDQIRQVFEHIQTSEKEVTNGSKTAKQALTEFGQIVHTVAQSLDRLDPRIGTALTQLGNSTRIYAGGNQEGLFDNLIKQTGASLGLSTLNVQDQLGLRDGSVEAVRNLEGRLSYDNKQAKKQAEAAQKFTVQDAQFTKYYQDLDANLQAFNTRLSRAMSVVLHDTASAGQRESAIQNIMKAIVDNVDAIKASGNRELIAYAKNLRTFHTFLHEALQDPKKLSQIPAKASSLYNTFSPYALDNRPVGDKVPGAAARTQLKTNVQSPFKDVIFSNAAADKAASVLATKQQQDAVAAAENIFKQLGSSSSSTDLRKAAKELLDVKQGSFRALANNLLTTAQALEDVASPDTSLSKLVKAQEVIKKSKLTNRADIVGLPGDLGTRVAAANAGGYAGVEKELGDRVKKGRDTLFTELKSLYAYAEKKEQEVKAGTANADTALKDFAKEALRVAQILAAIDPNVAARVNAVATAASNYTGSGSPKQQQEAKNLLNEVVRTSGLDAKSVRAQLTGFDKGTTALDTLEQKQQLLYSDKNTAAQRKRAEEAQKRAAQWVSEIDKHLNKIADFSVAHPIRDNAQTQADLARINANLQAVDKNHKPVTLDDLNKRAEQRIKAKTTQNKRATEVDDLGALAQSFGLTKKIQNFEKIAESGIYSMSKSIKRFGYQVFTETFSNLTSVIAFQLGRMLGDAYAQAQKIEDVVSDLTPVTVTNTGIVEKSAEVTASQDKLRNAIAGAGAVFRNGAEDASTYARGLYDLGYSTETIASNLDTLSKLAKIAHKDLGDLSKLSLPIDQLYGINNTNVGAGVLASAVENNVSAEKVAKNYQTLASNKDIRGALSIEEMTRYSVAAVKLGREVDGNLTTVINTIHEFNQVEVKDVDLGEIKNSIFLSTEALKALGIQFNKFLADIKKSGISTVFTGIAFALHTALVPLEALTAGFAKLMNSPFKPIAEGIAFIAGATLGFAALRLGIIAVSTQVEGLTTRFAGLATAERARGTAGALANASMLAGLGKVAGAVRTITTALSGWVGILITVGSAIYSIYQGIQNSKKASQDAKAESNKALKNITDELQRLADARSIELGVKVDPSSSQFLNDLAAGKLDYTGQLAGIDTQDLANKVRENPDFASKEQKANMNAIAASMGIARSAAQAIQSSMGQVVSSISGNGGPFTQLAANLAAASLSAKDMQLALKNINGPASEQALATLRGPINQFNAAAVEANLQAQTTNAQYYLADEYSKNKANLRKNAQDINNAERMQSNAGNEVTWVDSAREDLKREYDKIFNPTKAEREAYEAKDKALFDQRKRAIEAENDAIREINRLRANQTHLEEVQYNLEKARLEKQKKVYDDLENQFVGTNLQVTKDKLIELNPGISEAQRKQILDMTADGLRQFIASQKNGIQQSIDNLSPPTRQRPLELKKEPGSYDGTDYTKRLQNNAQIINGDEIVKSTLQVLQGYADANRAFVESPEAVAIKQIVEDLERSMANKDGVIWAQGRVQSLAQVKTAVAGYKLLLDSITETNKVISDTKFAGLTEGDPTKRLGAQLNVLRGGLNDLGVKTAEFLKQGITDPEQFSAIAGGLEGNLTQFINQLRSNFQSLADKVAGLAQDFNSRIENTEDNIKLRRLKMKYTYGVTDPFQKAYLERKAEIEVQKDKDQREISRVQAQMDMLKNFTDEITSNLGEWKLAITENTKALRQRPGGDNYQAPNDSAKHPDDYSLTPTTQTPIVSITQGGVTSPASTTTTTTPTGKQDKDDPLPFFRVHSPFRFGLDNLRTPDFRTPFDNLRGFFDEFREQLKADFREALDNVRNGPRGSEEPREGIDPRASEDPRFGVKYDPYEPRESVDPRTGVDPRDSFIRTEGRPDIRTVANDPTARQALEDLRQRYESEVPRLREEVGKLQDELSKLRGELERAQQTRAAIDPNDKFANMDKAKYDKIIADLEAKINALEAKLGESFTRLVKLLTGFMEQLKTFDAEIASGFKSAFIHVLVETQGILKAATGAVDSTIKTLRDKLSAFANTKATPGSTSAAVPANGNTRSEDITTLTDSITRAVEDGVARAHINITVKPPTPTTTNTTTNTRGGVAVPELGDLTTSDLKKLGKPLSDVLNGTNLDNAIDLEGKTARELNTMLAKYTKELATMRGKIPAYADALNVKMLAIKQKLETLAGLDGEAQASGEALDRMIARAAASKQEATDYIARINKLQEAGVKYLGKGFDEGDAVNLLARNPDLATSMISAAANNQQGFAYTTEHIASLKASGFTGNVPTGVKIAGGKPISSQTPTPTTQTNEANQSKIEALKKKFSKEALIKAFKQGPAKFKAFVQQALKEFKQAGADFFTIKGFLNNVEAVPGLLLDTGPEDAVLAAILSSVLNLNAHNSNVAGHDISKFRIASLISNNMPVDAKGNLNYAALPTETIKQMFAFGWGDLFEGAGLANFARLDTRLDFADVKGSGFKPTDAQAKAVASAIAQGQADGLSLDSGGIRSRFTSEMAVIQQLQTPGSAGARSADKSRADFIKYINEVNMEGGQQYDGAGKAIPNSFGGPIRLQSADNLPTGIDMKVDDSGGVLKATVESKGALSDVNFRITFIDSKKKRTQLLPGYHWTTKRDGDIDYRPQFTTVNIYVDRISKSLRQAGGTVEIYAELIRKPSLKITKYSKIAALKKADAPTPPIGGGVGGGIPLNRFSTIDQPLVTSYEATEQAHGKAVYTPAFQGFGKGVKTTLDVGIDYSTIPGLTNSMINSLPTNHMGFDIVTQDGKLLNPFEGAKVVRVSAGNGKDGVTGNGDQNKDGKRDSNDDGLGDGFGKTVVLQLKNGLQLLLAHFKTIDVKQGQVLKSGAFIGMQGSTGTATGVHTHGQLMDQNGATFMNEQQVEYLVTKATETTTAPVAAAVKEFKELRPDNIARPETITADGTPGIVITAVDKPIPVVITDTENGPRITPDIITVSTPTPITSPSQTTESSTARTVISGGGNITASEPRGSTNREEQTASPTRNPKTGDISVNASDGRVVITTDELTITNPRGKPNLPNPESDTKDYDVNPEVTIPGKYLVRGDTADGLRKSLNDLAGNVQTGIDNLTDKPDQAADTSDLDAREEMMKAVIDKIAQTQAEFISSLKSTLQQGITRLLSAPQEYFKRLQARGDAIKEMTFQGASIEAQRASLQGSASDIQSKMAKSKTLEEYNGYVQQLQQVESQLRDVNTQYAVWQESMRQTKEQGVKFGDFFISLFEDLGNQVANIFTERAGNIIMGNLFGDLAERGYVGAGNQYFQTQGQVDAYANRDKSIGLATPAVGGGVADSSTFGVKYNNPIEGYLQGIEANTQQTSEGIEVQTQVNRNGFAQSLTAALEAIAVQVIIATAINIFRAAMTKRESDSQKFTAPLDFDTTRGTKNPSGVRNLTVNTTVNGATQAQVTRIASNEVDKGINKLRFGV